MENFKYEMFIFFLLIFFICAISTFVLYLVFSEGVKTRLKNCIRIMEQMRDYEKDTRKILNTYMLENQRIAKDTDYQYKARGNIKKAKKKMATKWKRRRKRRKGTKG